MSASPGTGLRVPTRMPLPDVATFRSKLRSGPPVIFTGVVSRWPASSQWSFAWLRERFGTRKVLVGDRNGAPKRRALVSEFLDEIERGAKLYLANTELGRLIPELMAGVDFPAFRPYDALSRTDFWIGPAGTIATLHQDRPYNLNAQIIGRKRWLLTPPKQRFKQTGATWYSSFNAADLAPDRRESEQPPEEWSPEYDFVLEPGELLYLPPDWWHRVVSLEPSISISHWWFDLPTLLRQAPFLLKDATKVLRVLRDRLSS